MILFVLNCLKISTARCLLAREHNILFRTSLPRCICEINATLLAVAIIPIILMMSLSHLCLGFPLLIFHATIPCIIVFSKPLCRVTWPEYLFCDALQKYTANSLVDEVHLILKGCCDELSRVYCGSISSQMHLFFEICMVIVRNTEDMAWHFYSIIPTSLLCVCVFVADR